MEARKTSAKKINIPLKCKPCIFFNRRNCYLIKTENITPFMLNFEVLNGKYKPGAALYRS